MLRTTNLIFSAVLLIAPLVAASAEPAPQTQPGKVPRDPNQRVCEDVTTVGSRLASKRICATRAEWAEMRKADREVVDQAQRSANIGCTVINTHTGAPSC